MKSKSKNKSFPKLKTDKEAESFVRDADLTEYDFSRFKSVKFEFAHKTSRINMRLPEVLLERIRTIADKRNTRAEPVEVFPIPVLSGRSWRQLLKGNNDHGPGKNIAFRAWTI